MTESAHLNLSRWKRPRWPHGSDSGRIIKPHHVTCQTWRQTTFSYQIKLGSDAIRVTFTPQKRDIGAVTIKARHQDESVGFPLRVIHSFIAQTFHQPCVEDTFALSETFNPPEKRKMEVWRVCHYATSSHRSWSKIIFLPQRRRPEKINKSIQIQRLQVFHCRNHQRISGGTLMWSHSEWNKSEILHTEWVIHTHTQTHTSSGSNCSCLLHHFLTVSILMWLKYSHLCRLTVCTIEAIM